MFIHTNTYPHTERVTHLCTDTLKRHIRVHVHAYPCTHRDTHRHTDTQRYIYIRPDEHPLESFPHCWKALVQRLSCRMQNSLANEDDLLSRNTGIDGWVRCYGVSPEYFDILSFPLTAKREDLHFTGYNLRKQPLENSFYFNFWLNSIT